MAEQVTMKKTLGLTGVTVNAMALIAPGAFLWLTYQMQASQTVNGESTAKDMFAGLAFALVLALLTAISYAKLATLYPEAGTGSSYYFAEHAFMSTEKLSIFSRINKFVVGWFSHLYYWVYPGLMVGMFAILLNYITGQFGVSLSIPVQMLIAVGLSAITGFVAYRGVSGSTTFSVVINIIQIVTIIFISVLAIAYRLSNPQHVTFVFTNPLDIVMPHNFMNVMYQSSIAILVLVGFESATALAAESKSIKHVSRGTILSLVLQGLIFYFFEYFAANGWINTSYTGVDSTGAPVNGLGAAANSAAPIGDMVKNLGDTLLNNSGFICMILVAISVAIAVFGTTLSCMNTGVRVTYAMAKDEEMPTVLNALHIKHATPHTAVVIITIVSAVIGAFTVINLTTLTAVTLISNIGTFLLYGMTNLIALVAFWKQPKKNPITAIIIPILGAIANIGMLVIVILLAIVSGGATMMSALIAIGVSVVWLIVGIVYFRLHSKKAGKTILVKQNAEA
ncbi:MAG: APC family permease [Bacillota bacterium]|nr:APC family permease [Bacillota bacterium]